MRRRFLGSWRLGYYFRIHFAEFLDEFGLQRRRVWYNLPQGIMIVVPWVH